MKNAYLYRQQAIQNELINLGKSHGEQFALDCVEIVLHERFGWGYGRIKDMLDAVSERATYFHPAMCRDNPEQPIYQERFDNALKDIVKNHQHFYSFKERYPLISEASYDKPLRRKG